MNYYHVLNVAANASFQEIQTAYRTLRGLYHPDRGTGNREKFEQVQVAFNVLSDPRARLDYDREQGEGRYRRATVKLQENIVKIIEATELDNVDYIATLRGNVERYIKGIKTAEKELQRTISKFSATQGKISRATVGRNILTEAIESRVNDLTMQLRNLQDEKDVATVMLEILQYYKCNVQFYLT